MQFLTPPRVSAGLLCLALALVPQTASADSPTLIGCNLSGGEFAANVIPGVMGTNYFYPSERQWDWAKSQGMELVRLPFRWERVQRNNASGVPDATLWATDIAAIDTCLDYAEARGIHVILDMHNFTERVVTISGVQATYKIGTTQVPVADYANAWKLLADHFKNRKSVWGYDIMNEPVGLSGGVTEWKAMAQAAVTAIRDVDSNTPIILEGYFFAQASSWLTNGAPLLDVVDPADNLIFSAHMYPDNDQSGTWSHGGTVTAELVPSRYPSLTAAMQVGVDRIKPFVDWCVANNVRGLVGEYGAHQSVDTANWGTILANQLDYMKNQGAGLISGTQWGAGAWGPSYAALMTPRKNHSNPPPIADVLPAFAAGPGTNYWHGFNWYDDSVTVTADYSSSYVYPVTTPETISLTTGNTSTAYTGSKSIRLAYTVPTGTAASAGIHVRGPLSAGAIGGVDMSNNYRAGHVLSFYAKGTVGASPRITLARTTDSNGVDTGGITGTGNYVSIGDIHPLSSSWQLYEIPLADIRNTQVTFDDATTVQRIVFDAKPANGAAYEVFLDKVAVGLPTTAVDPGVSVNTSTGLDTFSAGDPVTLVATASAPGGYVDYVEFYADGTKIGIDDTTPYEWATSFTDAGTVEIRAIVIDGHGVTTRSVAKTLTIGSSLATIIQDNADATGVTVTGYWVTSGAPSTCYAGNYRHDGNNGSTGGRSMRFTPTVASAGTYELYGYWTGGSARASNAPVDIMDGNGTLHTISVDQRVDGTGWVLLGTYQLSAGTSCYVNIRNDGAVGTVVADAVKWVQQPAAPAPVTVIQDNADATGITVTGYWVTSGAPSTCYAGNYRHDGNNGATGGRSVRFTPTVPTAGTYSLYGYWTGGSARASNAPVDIMDGNGTLHTISVDQRVDGTGWVLLGTYQLSAGTSCYAMIRNDGANGTVVADAVMWVKP